MLFTRLIYPLAIREKISHRVGKLLKTVGDKNVPLSMIKNIRLDLNYHDVAHRSIIFNGFYELGFSKTIIKMAKKGGLLIDVGANYGYFTCLWASVNPKNKVVAFEASPLNIEPLKINISKNNLHKQVIIEPKAVGKEEGTLMFSLCNTEGQTGWGGLSLEQQIDDVAVEAITLDTYATINEINEIDVLKIDTEGADTWVLYGAKNLLLQKRIKHIHFEKNPFRMTGLKINYNDPEQFLNQCGYKVSVTQAYNFYACPA